MIVYNMKLVIIGIFLCGLTSCVMDYNPYYAYPAYSPSYGSYDRFHLHKDLYMPGRYVKGTVHEKEYTEIYVGDSASSANTKVYRIER
jgi:hypothetical protein